MTDTAPKVANPEVGKAKDKKFEYLTRARIYMGNGNYVKPGTVIELTEAEAEYLGVVEPVVVQTKKSKDEKAEK